ncbi:tautomerase family protein [Nocardia tengchongensis]|uniref:tautomerase family protein n=1 Tax=Nocardia tengchongensis TaxID=2055889 RepID=UPI003676265A
MAQVKIYAHKDFLDTGTTRADISQSIHGAVMATLDYPAEKKVHRFFPMVAEDFVHMADRGGTYTIIEISLFEGRSIQARKQLIRELFTRLAASPASSRTASRSLLLRLPGRTGEFVACRVTN